MSKSSSNFMCYMLRIAETRTAVAEYETASVRLELARIRERSAELASQCFESVAGGRAWKSQGDLTEREREIGIAFARYAECGRTDKA